jgi:hypothetical protein
MKKMGQINFRIDDDLKAEFARVHNQEGKSRDASETIRELMRSAIRYYDKYGNLYPPWDLVAGSRAGEGSTTAHVIQVHNGNGHQVLKAAEPVPKYRVGKK